MGITRRPELDCNRWLGRCVRVWVLLGVLCAWAPAVNPAQGPTSWLQGCRGPSTTVRWPAYTDWSAPLHRRSATHTAIMHDMRGLKMARMGAFSPFHRAGELGPWAATGLVLRDSLTNRSGVAGASEHGGFKNDAGGKIAEVHGLNALWPAPNQVLSIAIPFLCVFTGFQVYRRLRYLRTLQRIRRSELSCVTGAPRESIAQT